MQRLPMWCVIPAAGRGNRLRTLTAGCPKALLEVSGRPLVEHLLDRLHEPFTDVCLVTSPDHFGSFRRLLGNRYQDLRLHLTVQTEPTGVADAVSQAAGVVRGPFVVLMGDCYYDSDLSSFPLQWQNQDSHGAVLVEPADEAGGQPMGLVTLAGNRIGRIFKAPWEGETEWRVCGAFLFPESFFAVAAAMPRAESGEFELEDVVTRLIATGATFHAIPYEGWRRNINTPDDVAAVEERIAAGPAPRLGD